MIEEKPLLQVSIPTIKVSLIILPENPKYDRSPL